MPIGCDRNVLVFFVNGVRHEVGGRGAFLSLARYLREQASLPGTKIVCAEGDCGACTVLVSRLVSGKWTPLTTVNSCISPVYLFDSCMVVTVEGLSEQSHLSEIQDKMLDHHGAQCGYCTPGIVCSLAHLAETSQAKGIRIDRKRAQNYLTGNLCRCTGYDPILKAAENIDLMQWRPLGLRYLTDERTDYCQFLASQNVLVTAGNRRAWLPTQVGQALAIKSASPHIRLVAGATDLGVLHNKGRQYLDEVLVLNRISELSEIRRVDDGVMIGATASLSEVEDVVESSHFELARLLRVFASPQIKHQGTLVGNLVNASPIADTIPALLVMEARLGIKSATGSRWVELKHFYQDYKKFDLRPGEVVTEVFIPNLPQGAVARFYKASMRKDLDISSVTFAGVLQVKGGQIVSAKIALGGVGPIVMRLPNVENELTGKEFSENSLARAGDLAVQSVHPIDDVRASSNYRRLVAKNFFKKYFVETAVELNQ